MKSFQRTVLLSSALLSMSLVLPRIAAAGGCFFTTKNGSTLAQSCPRWDQTKDVIWNYDAGPVKGPANEANPDGSGSGGGGSGCQLAKNLDVSNADGVAMIERAFKRWMDVDGAKLNIVKGAALNDGKDVDFSNIENFWTGGFVWPQPADSKVDAAGCYDDDPNTPCLNPIIFDHSGLITDAIQGQCAHCSILGFAAPLYKTADDFPQNTIIDNNIRSAQAVVSGACLEPRTIDPICQDCCPKGLTVDNIEGTMTHELGHYLGLDHTMTAKKEFIDCNDDNGCDEATKELIPTMIAFFVPGMNFNTLTEDDNVIFRSMYPDTNLASTTCSVSGIARRNDNTPQRGLEVVARLVSNQNVIAASTISGAFSKRKTQGAAGAEIQGDITDGKTIENCTSVETAENCAHYEIHGLTPGEYYLQVQDFTDTDGTNMGFVIEPLSPPFSSGSVLDNPITATTNCDDPQPGVAKNSCLQHFTCTAGNQITVKDVKAN